MNIFFLHKDPILCAQQHCDKHVVKMIVEYAQLLSTAHRVIDGNLVRTTTQTGRKINRWILSDQRENLIYIATHVNHPSAQWVRHSKEHYNWLVAMWYELMNEYTFRYGKNHRSGIIARTLLTQPTNISNNQWIDPPPAMPDVYKIKNDSVLSYQNYYNISKRKFATWKNRTIPAWFYNYKPTPPTLTQKDTEYVD